MGCHLQRVSSGWAIVFLLLLNLARKAHAAHNITVDDTDRSIVYTGTWSATQPDGNIWDHGGTHRLTNSTIDPENPTATFTFTGVGVFYWSPKWPYSVSTALQLDGANTIDLVDLQDHSVPTINNAGAPTVASQIVWGKSGLANTTHRLVASRGSGVWAVVDALTYTVLDASDASDSSTSTTTTDSGISATVASNSYPNSTPAQTSPSTKSSSSKTTTIAAVASAVGGAILAAFICTFLYWFFYRRQNQKQDPRAFSITSDSTFYPYSGGLAPAVGMQYNNAPPPVAPFGTVYHGGYTIPPTGTFMSSTNAPSNQPPHYDNVYPGNPNTSPQLLSSPNTASTDPYDPYANTSPSETQSRRPWSQGTGDPPDVGPPRDQAGGFQNAGAMAGGSGVPGSSPAPTPVLKVDDSTMPPERYKAPPPEYTPH